MKVQFDNHFVVSLYIFFLNFNCFLTIFILFWFLPFLNEGLNFVPKRETREFGMEFTKHRKLSTETALITIRESTWLITIGK